MRPRLNLWVKSYEDAENVNNDVRKIRLLTLSSAYAMADVAFSFYYLQ